MKLFFFDTETTGTDSKIHGIHQLSGIIEIDGKIVENFNLNIVPWDGCEYAEEALTVTGKTEEQIKVYPNTERQAVSKIITIFDKYVKKFDKKDKMYMVGYNVHFDNQMLRELFIRAEENYFGSYLWSNPIDVMTLATIRLANHRPYMDNFQLMTVAKCFGLLEGKELNFHDAMFDIEITKDMYYFLTEPEPKIELKSVPIEEEEVPLEYRRESFSVDKALEILDDVANTPEPKRINTEGMKSLKKIDSDNLDKIVTFGKYKGYSFKSLLIEDPQYLLWISDNLIQGIKFSDEVLAQIRTNRDIKNN